MIELGTFYSKNRLYHVQGGSDLGAKFNILKEYSKFAINLEVLHQASILPNGSSKYGRLAQKRSRPPDRLRPYMTLHRRHMTSLFLYFSGTVYFGGLRYEVLTNSTSSTLYLIPTADAFSDAPRVNHTCGKSRLQIQKESTNVDVG